MPPEKKNQQTTNSNPFDMENPFDELEIRLSPIDTRKRAAIQQIIGEWPAQPPEGTDILTRTFMPSDMSREERGWLRENLTPEDLAGLNSFEMMRLARGLGIKDYSTILPPDTPLGSHYYDQGITSPGDIPVTEEEWLKNRILNANWNRSALQMVVHDLPQFFHPLERRDPTPIEEGGDPDKTLFPHIQNFIAALNEIGIKTVGDVPGAGQLFKIGRFIERKTGRLDPIDFSSNETPHLDRLIDAVVSRWNLGNPRVRAAIDQLIDEDPVGYLADAAFVPSVTASAVLKGARTASLFTRGIARIPRLPEPVALRIARTQATMDSILGVTQRVNRFVNHSMYTIPGDLPWIGGFKIPGAATFPDLGALTFDVATQSLTQGFRRGRESNRIAVRDLYDAETGDQLRSLGVDPKEYAASAQATDPGANAVAAEEARRFKEGDPETVKRLIDTAENLDNAMTRLADDIDVGRSFDESMKLVTDAYDDFINEYRGTRTGLYRAIQEREALPMSLNNTFQTLQTILDENSERVTGTGASALTGELAAFSKNIERFRSQADPPQPLAAPTNGAGTPPGESPTPPAIGTPNSPNINAGMPRRMIHSPADLNAEFPVTYQVIDIRTLVPSHTAFDPGSTRTPEAQYPAAYQPKEMDEVGRALIETGARTLKPFALIDFERSMDRGAPLLDKGSRILGGNHRYWMMMRAIEAYPDRWKNYVDYMKLIVPLEYGIAVDAINAIEFPVLVQVLGDGVDPTRVAQLTGVRPTGGFSQASRAQQNASFLSDDTLAKLNIPANPDALENILRQGNNDEFVREILDRVATADINQLKEWETNGAVNNDGYRAIVNMIHSNTYTTDAGLRMLNTFLDVDTPGMKNLRRGLFRATTLPKFEMEIRAGRLEAPFSIADDLAHAMNKFDELRKEGSTVADAMTQQTLPGLSDAPESAKMLLPLLAASTTEPSKLTAFISDYIAEATNASSLANPLLALATGPPISKEALVTKLVDKHAGDGNINAAIDELVEAAKAEADDGGGTGGKTQVQMADAVSEYRYINGERARTMFREMADNENLTPTQQRWAKMLERSLDTDMIETIEAAFPEKAGEIRAVYNYVWQMSTIINSKFAKSIAKNFDEVFIKETGETVPDQGEQLVRLLVTPRTSVGQIRNYRQLLGGEGSPAWKTFQRIFVENMLLGGLTPEGRLAFIDRGRGTDPRSASATRRHNPQGISRVLSSFINPFNPYADAVVTELLGPDTTTKLYALNDMTRRLAQLYQNTNGSQTAFLQKKNLIEIFRDDQVIPLLTTLGGGLFGLGAYGDVYGAAYAGGAMTFVGAYRLLRARYGKDAATRFLDGFNKFGDFTNQEVADVFRKTWAQETYRFLQNAARTGVRTHRLEQRDPTTGQWIHPFTRPYQQ